MNKKHAKSPCCGASTIQYGGKRRQCTSCKRTWTIRPKRRGRKPRRRTSEPVRKYLVHERVPLSREKGRESVSARSNKLRNERDAFNDRKSWASVPPGPLIVVADAIMRRIEGSLHTWFFVFVRPVDGEDAIILPPLCLRGTETTNGWQPAFAAIPDDVLSRIMALVSDGHRSLMLEALWRGWLVQRCHFHLLRALQARRSRWSSSQHQAEGIEIHTLVKRVLSQETDKGLATALSRIEEIGWTTTSKKLSIALLGFVTNAKEFRTYRAHPELNLPTTNNTAESLNALIQELSGRARGFRTVASFNAWIIALCKERQTIKCRGARPQN